MKLIGTREVIKEFIPRYAKGKTLDIGGGTSKYKNIITPHVEEYLVSDLYKLPGVDFIEDARKLKHSDNTFDTVLSFQVLEHIDDTRTVVKEMYRVLKNNGMAIVTAPFITPEHGVPGDYHRFTVEGIKWYFEKEGFKIVEVGKQGGIFATISELMRFGLLNPLKKHGRVKKAILSRVLNAIKRLDKWNRWPNPDFYANVYIVARK